MSALKVQHTLNEIERNMQSLAPYRTPALFNHFLVKGYSAITLSSVSPVKYSSLLQAKLCLGTLITLYDDFADRPTQYDPKLLDILYQLDFQKYDSFRIQNQSDHPVVVFAESLFTQMVEILKRQPHYHFFSDVLNFDLKQFYSANHFSSILTAIPQMNNSLENRLYAHHNMGMVLVATMDLMTIEYIKFSELGSMREVFLMGQRMGRIYNVLATRKREVLDGDITGELAIYLDEHKIEAEQKKLRNELCDLSHRIANYDAHITTFSVKTYLQGLENVQSLHEQMSGVI